MLEVEVAANTVYAWAAEEIVARRLAEECPSDSVEYAAAVRLEAQALRYRATTSSCVPSSTTRSTTDVSASNPSHAATLPSDRCSTSDRDPVAINLVNRRRRAYSRAEGEGFEPSADRKARNGFRDEHCTAADSAPQKGIRRLACGGCCTMCCIRVAETPSDGRRL
jgi:hypothetical protein